MFEYTKQDNQERTKEKYYIHMIGGTKFFYEGNLLDVKPCGYDGKLDFTCFSHEQNVWVWFSKRLANVNNITFIERIGE